MIFREQAHTKKIFCMHTRTSKSGFLINDFLHAGECEEDSLHAYAYDENGILDLCMHSHGMKIEMCNAGVHLRTLRN